MKILNIIKYDLKKMTRERAALIITFLMPVLLILIFGNLNFGDGANTPKIPVGITNYDGSSAASELLNEVKKDNSIAVADLKEEELYNQVKNSDIIVGLVIPEGFNDQVLGGKKPEIKVIKLPASTDYGYVLGIVSSAYAKLNAEKSVQLYFDEKLSGSNLESKDSITSEIKQKVDDYLNKPALVSVDSKIYAQTKATAKTDQRTTYTLSFSIVFIMWAIVFAAGEILQEKKTNTWERLNVTPTGKSTILLGKILGTFVRGWVQVVFLIVFSKLIMGVNWGDPTLTLILVSVFLLCVTSFGMFLSSLVKTFAQLGAITAIVITCTSMLSGCYWPIEIMPEGMQKMAKIFPQYWALKGLTGNVENLGANAVVTPVLVLTGIGLLFFMLNILVYRFKVLKKVS
jgi:ABC-2 type transport system permease protein